MERLMSKKMQQIAALLLVLTACLGLLEPVRAVGADPYADLKIRVGLAYNTGALVSANLLNVTGSGYRFGYYDAKLDFVEVGHSPQTAITMVKTRNIYLAGATYSETVPTGSYQTLGCYHLKAPGSYATFDEAAAQAEAYTDGFPAWIEGEYQVRTGAYVTSSEAQAAANELGEGWSVVWTTACSFNIVPTGSVRILFQFDGGSKTPLGVMPDETGSYSPDETVTWFKGFKYHGGFRYERIDGGDITVVNVVSLDAYLKGVVPYESVKTWPMEALKAQAMCAKNYALTGLNKHRTYHFDVCTTTDCQVYYGMGNTNSSPSEWSDQAVEQTRGIYVWYDGKLAETYFYSSNGGGSESVKNVWGSSGYPYLEGVDDPFEADVADQAYNYYWTRSVTKQQLTQTLQTLGYCQNTRVENFEVTEYSATGNVLEIKFTYANGRSNTFLTSSESSRKLRSSIGVNSIRFTIQSGQLPTQSFPVNSGTGGTLMQTQGAYAITGSGTVSQITGESYIITGDGTVASTGAVSTIPEDTFLVTGTGWGHSIGYSQWGGCAMALRGYTYPEIIQYYFTGVTIGPAN